MPEHVGSETQGNNSPFNKCKEVEGKLSTLKLLIKNLEDELDKAKLFERGKNMMMGLMRGKSHIIELEKKLETHRDLLRLLEETFTENCRKNSVKRLRNALLLKNTPETADPFVAAENTIKRMIKNSNGKVYKEELALLHSLKTPQEMTNTYNYNQAFSNNHHKRKHIENLRNQANKMYPSGGRRTRKARKVRHSSSRRRT
jgi:hypothetical protein